MRGKSQTYHASQRQSLVPLSRPGHGLFRLVFRLPFISRTPEVFLLPLSFVRTPSFDGALLAFSLCTLALVSMTPFRGALLLLFLLLLFAFESLAHAALRLRATIRQRNPAVRFMFCSLSRSGAATGKPVRRDYVSNPLQSTERLPVYAV